MSGYQIFPLIQTVLCLILALIILRHSNKQKSHWLFIIFLFCLSAYGLLIFAMRSSPNVDSALTWERSLGPVVILISAFFFHFTIELTSTRVQSWLLPVIYLLCLASIPLSFTDLIFSGMQIKSYGYAPVLGILAPLHTLISYALLIASLVILFRKMRSSQFADQKNRLLYIILGTIISLIGAIFDLLPIFGLPLYPGLIFGNIVFCLLTSIAIIRHSLLDIKIILKKGSAYFLISVVIALPFLVVLFLSSYFPSSQIPIFYYIAFLFIVAMAVPWIWHSLQVRVDRLFNRDRYNYLKTLESTIQETQSLEDSDEIAAKIMNLISKALHVDQVYLMQMNPLKGEVYGLDSITNPIQGNNGIISQSSPLISWLEKKRTIIEYSELDLIPQLMGIIDKEKSLLTRNNIAIISPLLTGNKRIVGLLLLGPKLSEQPYSLEDKKLITAISNQIAVKFENIRLYNESRKSWKNLMMWINGMTDSIIVADSSQKITFINNSGIRMFGNFLGKQCHAIFNRDTICQGCQVWQGNNPGNPQCNFRARVGSKHYDIAVAPLTDADGNPSIIEVIRDITSQEEMEQKLQLSSRLATVGEMAAGIAHEINNPLTGVIGYAQLLSTQNLPPEIKADLGKIYDGANRVASIVKRLLSFARQTQPTRNLININEIIKTTLELRAYQLKNCNIEVITSLSPDLPQTVADGSQMQQVFLNIIINAEMEMAAAHGKGKLYVRTEETDGSIRISFKDNGPGIREENLARIFDPFFTTKEVGKGTGLGLSICHSIMLDHNGTIYAESKFGEGATFIVELPVISTAGIKESTKTLPEIKSTAVGAKIIVADDEDVVRKYMQRVLSKEGYQVDAVISGRELINKIKDNKYDLMLVDLKMPDMSGIDAYNHIKNSYPELVSKIVFITGDVMNVEANKFITETKARCLNKPFEQKQLIHDIKVILENAE